MVKEYYFVDMQQLEAHIKNMDHFQAHNEFRSMMYYLQTSTLLCGKSRALLIDLLKAKIS